MKKLLALLTLGLMATGAQAATYTITGGAWDELFSWSPIINPSPASPDVLDNGAAGPVQQGFGAGNPWGAPGGDPIPTLDGTYSGTIITDVGTGAVVGGSLNYTGNIGYLSLVNGNSFFFLRFEDGAWNLDTGVATSTLTCHTGDFAGILNPAICDQQVLSNYNLSAGNEGFDGAARVPVDFDPSTGKLRLFAEGWNLDMPSGGTDYSLEFTVAFVPVPAAVWLFVSALGVLGWFRRRVIAEH